ncbi:TonB-dependent receptor [Stenotrophomonas sp. JAI102]|uniref:TonB-dependent receptor domain-containing protein n=1 Tax=Stenotrophomonas sp. JAI102 TaxID=2723077 RepID=UPI0015C9DC9E|nr:TonB-dependent receptor [Stenotrophomonas sp. JAI102]NYF34364.1 outer membrane receptor protein involved in Fe transport [Stenotrophomonas sp. JAI102]
MSRYRSTLSRHPLTAAVLTGMLLTSAVTAFAQDSSTTNLDKVTVTGSLIPQTEIETHTPVVTITAEDIQTRGFTSVADVLQQSSLTTGGLQGGQTSASFTQGAEAAGMFGLSPSYTKYLINGRPMLSYPALYNGGDTFNNISGIPIDIVERIEILPGGQSSLYGSDAIAGVVNIILKERMDGSVLNVRGGTYTEGGGSTFRVSGATGFNSADDRLNVLVNAQFESSNPIWGYQRDVTRTTNGNGYTAQVPTNDFLVVNPAAGNAYLMMDPNLCANVAGQFGGTTVLGTRAAGQSCGSIYSPGYKTVKNGKDSAQIYSSFTFDANDSLQLFGDVLYSYEDVKYATGSNYTWWGTASGYGRFWDQTSGQWMNLQRAFAPEDISANGYKDILNTDRNKAYQVTLGGRGTLGNWDYSASFTRGEYKLTERNFVRWADPINSYFEEHVLGPQLGTRSGYAVFAPNWDAFYAPIPAGDFATFTGYTESQSRTWQNLGRFQITNGTLFSLPGGDAGFAVVAEAGSEGWDYTPDERLMDGSVWGTTAVAGAGHRSNYALTSELRLPLLDSLTVTGSGRYDAFKIGDSTVDKATYSIGVEFRPIESLLFRGKYGTAFRAPSLSDAFQGLSGYYANGATDYYRCGQLGYAPTDTTGCAYDSVSVFGQRAGNPDLEPITADVWNAGVVWAPLSNLSFSVDYYNWKIKNEVDTLSSDQLLLAEYYCRNGQVNNTSASCDNVNDWITRDASGVLDDIYTPKMNVASQNLQAITASAKYVQELGRFGALQFSTNYTNMIKRELQPQPGDEYLDLLRDPYNMWIYDSYAKVRADGSLAWALDKWTTTLYFNYVGKTPNYLAYAGNGYDYVHSSGAKAGKWGSYTTYNLSVNYRAAENMTFSVMVNNVFNKMPDNQASNYPGTSGTPYNNYFYNIYGRAVYVQAKYEFGAK